MNHDPMCATNISCAVYHTNGVCPDKKQCTCNMNKKSCIKDTTYDPNCGGCWAENDEKGINFMETPLTCCGSCGLDRCEQCRSCHNAGCDDAKAMCKEYNPEDTSNKQEKTNISAPIHQKAQHIPLEERSWEEKFDKDFNVFKEVIITSYKTGDVEISQSTGERLKDFIRQVERDARNKGLEIGSLINIPSKQALERTRLSEREKVLEIIANETMDLCENSQEFKERLFASLSAPNEV